MDTLPSSFLQSLALQTQVLANLQWLCEFQVLACIPLDGEVAFDEVADIINVPVDQLQRVVRLMITASFLCEQTSGYIAHTPLSASFVRDPELQDAALFLAQVAVPAALEMPRSLHESPSATNTKTGNTLARPDENFDATQPKLKRQVGAYFAHGILDEASAIDDVLRLADWVTIGAATVVDVHPPSTSTAAMLTALAPAVQFVVQTSSPSERHSGLISETNEGSVGESWMAYHLPPSISNRVSVQSRTIGTSQTVVGAAVYILRVPSPSPLLSWVTVRSQTLKELQVHLRVLRTQPSSRLIVTSVVLSPPATIDSGSEAAVRLRDTALLQLSNERQPSKEEIVELITSTKDQGGVLVVNQELRTRKSAAIGFEVQYVPANNRGQ
ncbi:hypothetical protein BDV19DRAFT_397452 [Aspergillus venezuelensis]